MARLPATDGIWIEPPEARLASLLCQERITKHLPNFSGTTLDWGSELSSEQPSRKCPGINFEMRNFDREIE
jgi:hypothetical protein